MQIMTPRNRWFDFAISMSYHFSCYIFSINALYIGVVLFVGDSVSTRNWLILVFTLMLWLFVAYSSVDVWWKTIIKTLLFSVSLMSIFLFFLGVLIFVNLFFRPENEVNIYIIPFLIIASTILYFSSIRVMRSKFLK